MYIADIQGLYSNLKYLLCLLEMKEPFISMLIDESEELFVRVACRNR